MDSLDLIVIQGDFEKQMAKVNLEREKSMLCRFKTNKLAGQEVGYFSPNPSFSRDSGPRFC